MLEPQTRHCPRVPMVDPKTPADFWGTGGGWASWPPQLPATAGEGVGLMWHEQSRDPGE